jgi:hypothetical protein
MKTTILAILMLAFFVSGINSQQPKYENSDSATGLLTSYYDAINRKDYRRAYGYWQNPSDGFEDFAKGFAETEKVRLIVEPPNRFEGAAGSLYTQVPTVLISTMKNGKNQMFAGCYTLRKSNLRPPDIPKETGWHIYRANLKTIPADAEIPQMLAEACQDNKSMPDDRQPARVLGVIGFESEKLSDAVKTPATVEANKDFEITVTTSGNGCFSAGDTGVVLTDTSADVFVYDLTTATRPGIACTMILKQLEHKATLRFTKSGEAVIRVWARKQGGDSPFGEPVVIEKRIMVR